MISKREINAGESLAGAVEVTFTDPSTTPIILQMDRPTFEALAASVEVAFEDPASTPDEYQERAEELINFFRRETTVVTQDERA